MIVERLAPEGYDTIEGIPDPAENPLLIGHDRAATLLAEGYRAGKLPHALLLVGPQGIGKATLAFHLAYHLLRYPEPEAAPATLAIPDPASALHRQIAIGAHPGVLHLSRPANETGKGFKTVIPVDAVRKVSRFLSMTAHDGGYRIIIVDPADDMNVNAANALLKNLEEPPRRTIFILISHSPGRLLPTIRSRCQTVLLQPLAAADLAAVLSALGVALPGEAAAKVAERVAGSPREAILLTQYGGLEISQALDRLVSAPRIDIAKAHRLADAVAARDQTIQFDIFNAHVQDILTNASRGAVRAGDLPRASRLSAFWEEALRVTEDVRTYNLDKKQHVLGMIHGLHKALQA